MIRQRLDGVFNIAGDGVVDSLDILEWCRVPGLPRHAGSSMSFNSMGRQLSKHPLIMSSAKFKQSAGSASSTPRRAPYARIAIRSSLNRPERMTASCPMVPEPVVIDTDPGVDDAMPC